MSGGVEEGDVEKSMLFCWLCRIRRWSLENFSTTMEVASTPLLSSRSDREKSIVWLTAFRFIEYVVAGGGSVNRDIGILQRRIREPNRG